jgi:hypothetical protein
MTLSHAPHKIKNPPCILTISTHKSWMMLSFKVTTPPQLPPGPLMIDMVLIIGDLSPIIKTIFLVEAFDLHVLSMPPAFVLSQDQTLILNHLISTAAHKTHIRDIYHYNNVLAFALIHKRIEDQDVATATSYLRYSSTFSIPSRQRPTQRLLRNHPTSTPDVA